MFSLFPIDRYDPARGIARLQETWVSTANSLQRRGRAGRVQPGDCYRLFSRKTAAGLEVRPPAVQPCPAWLEEKHLIR